MAQSSGWSSRMTQAAVVSILVIFALLIHLRINYQNTPIVSPEPSGDVEVAFISKVNPNKPLPVPSTTQLTLTKPANTRIIALIFFGRRNRVEILNHYLQRNLPEQGGWVDELHFVRNTDEQEDLVYLESLVSNNPRYKILTLPPETDKDERFAASWNLLEPDSIYIKIDDDVVFLADDTIPRIVTRKIAHPEYLLVSANLINSPLMSKVHYDIGAYRPYLPVHDSIPSEFYSQFERAHQAGDTRWEFTHYPNWTGPPTYTLEHDTPAEGLSPVWLRMQDDSDILRTPVCNVTYDTWGPGWMSWSIAAQSHLSLLENLYFQNTSVYYDALNEIWFTDYDRLSINLIAVDANEILSHLPVDKDVPDEEWITVVLPKRIGKHVAVETRALAAHFSFSTQSAINSTDVLERYADFAEKNVRLRPEQFGVEIFGDRNSFIQEDLNS